MPVAIGILKPKHPLAHLFSKREVPLISHIPDQHDGKTFYWLDSEVLTDEQIGNLVSYIKFKSPEKPINLIYERVRTSVTFDYTSFTCVITPPKVNK
jgi:hypothetical protein